MVIFGFLYVFAWIMFQLVSNIFFGFICRIGDLVRVKLADIGPERTLACMGGPALSVEVFVVIAHWLATEVAHGLAAFARHLVAPFLLEVLLLALGTLPQHGLRHGILHLGPCLHLGVLLNLVAGERDMTLQSTVYKQHSK